IVRPPSLFESAFRIVAEILGYSQAALESRWLSLEPRAHRGSRHPGNSGQLRRFAAFGESLLQLLGKLGHSEHCNHSSCKGKKKNIYVILTDDEAREDAQGSIRRGRFR